ncbi:hypothetical protein [Cryptosporangium phraense]|uniref:Uncharacterized protein n=1 Tax=Cryptosporangium phraense TaxID=2593070 RepID=A0A545AUH0_9ACTN|nr:hypothetical protein [Cryptosporangium phraense]TQS44980.1 hypothetical protein FL583_10765 [Cryptosporangium phraense]
MTDFVLIAAVVTVVLALVAFGVAVGLAALVRNRLEAPMFDVTEAQAAEIKRAVRDGRAVDEPALAGAAVERARFEVGQAERGFRRIRWVRWIVLLGAAIALIGFAFSLSDGLDSSAVLSAVWSVIVVVLYTVVLPAQFRHRIARARAAITANG